VEIWQVFRRTRPSAGPRRYDPKYRVTP